MKIKITKLPSSNKLSYGGSTNKLGGDFTNNVTFINEGGTHESNPFEGVPFGVDKEGTPNLVEEGEVIWNDYVFSNRLKVPGKKHTFAVEAEKLQKESAERPNDLISQKGLQDSMQRLIGLQEEVRNKRKEVQEKKAQNSSENTFDVGGPVDISGILKAAGEDVTYTPSLDIDPTPLDIDPTIVAADKAFYDNLISKKGNITLNKANRAFKNALDEDSSKFDWGALGNGLMRISPLIANATDLIRNLKEPDYTEGDRVLEVANAAPISDIEPEIEDINIRPIDRNYLLSQQLNQGNTLLSNIGNQAINAQQAMVNMMLANAQTQRAIGDSLIKMDEANLARQMQESEFNRGNQQLLTQSRFQNFANNAARHRGIMDATKYSSAYNTQMDAARAQGISGAMGNMATSLAGVGTENVWRDIIDKHPSLLYNSKGEYKQSKNGGRLLTSNKRRK